MKKNSAFSLIEISIVILVIGILIAGITQSTRLVKESGLMSARSLTQSSPVAGIKDLMSWHETSLKTSFDSDAQIDGSTIATWYDNGKQSTTQNSAIQGTISLRPLFKEYIFDGAIPAVRFDGLDDYLYISREISEDFTIIAVFKTTGGSTLTGTNWYNGAGIFDAEVGGAAKDFGLTIQKSGRILAGTGGPDTTIYDDGSYNDGRAHMVFFTRTQSSGAIKLYADGGKTALASSSSATTSPLISPARITFGSLQTLVAGRYLDGDVAEIIIYSRALTTEERESIATYLSRKYKIKIT